MTELARDKIIDAHVHVWTPDTDKYPLATGFDKSDFWLPSFTPDDHFAYSRAVGKVRINLVQMTWYGLDHSYILDLIAADPDTFVGTGIVPALLDVTLASPERAMIALSQRGIYAFRVRGAATARMGLGDWPRWLDHEPYEKMFAAGAEHNLALSFLSAPGDLPELDRMCSRFPETPVIIDHIAGVKVTDGVLPEDEVSALCDMAKYPRVMVKIGPLNSRGDGSAPFLDTLPLVKRVIEAFGPDRCMWESDSGGPVRMGDPVKEYQAAIAIIRDHADFLSVSDKEQVLYKTAEDFFFNR